MQLIDTARNLNRLLSDEPNWLIAALIGAFLGICLPYLFLAIRFLLRLMRSDQFCGNWYHHFYNYQGGVVNFKTETWKVRRGLRKRFLVIARSTVAGEPIYRGFAWFEKDFLVVQLRAGGHEEEVFQRFHRPVPAGVMTLVGVSIAQDYDGRASAGGNVLSQRRLGEKQVRDLLERRIILDSSSRVMHVRTNQG